MTLTVTLIIIIIISALFLTLSYKRLMTPKSDFDEFFLPAGFTIYALIFLFCVVVLILELTETIKPI